MIKKESVYLNCIFKNKRKMTSKKHVNSKIKLVQIIAEIDAIGGGPKHVLGILNNIDQTKFDLFLICPAGELSSEAKNIKGIEVLNVDMDSKFNLSAILKIRKYLSQIQAKGNPFGPMIVHTHGPRAGLLGRESIKAGMISVYTEHIWGPGYHLENRFNEILQKRMLKRLNLKTHLVIAVSNAVKKYLIDEKLALEERVIVIPNGITITSNLKPPRFAKAPRDRQTSKIRSRNYNNQIIGTVGSLKKIKGQIFLIQAMPEVIKKFPHLMLEIVGEGEERENLQSQISNLKIERHVTLLGKKNHIEEIISRWSVFVLPSIAETFGISILEANAAGVPVVASGVGGVADIIKDQKTGILIEPEKPHQIAKAIIKLLEHPAYAAKLARGGREKVREFEWKKVIGQLEKAYLKLVK